mmetsp:Transcript_27051/g.87379  ORF Transcript_27051/g.87379 Transcript_27051/m.87379 type:complete len:224 (+) Transcript_27051:393-1064(+)|eukprot:scaffold4031_cov101-Isochrysis_galbana.AAC.2
MPALTLNTNVDRYRPGLGATKRTPSGCSGGMTPSLGPRTPSLVLKTNMSGSSIYCEASWLARWAVMPTGTFLAAGRWESVQWASASEGLLTCNSTACGQATWCVPKSTAFLKVCRSRSVRDSSMNGLKMTALSGKDCTVPLSNEMLISALTSRRDSMAACAASTGALRAATDVRSEEDPTAPDGVAVAPAACDAASDALSSASEGSEAPPSGSAVLRLARRFF